MRPLSGRPASGFRLVCHKLVNSLLGTSLYFETGRTVTGLASLFWLQLVPHFPSGIVKRAKHERAWKSPTRLRRDAAGDRVSFALLSLRETEGLLSWSIFIWVQSTGRQGRALKWPLEWGTSFSSHIVLALLSISWRKRKKNESVLKERVPQPLKECYA